MEANCEIEMGSELMENTLSTAIAESGATPTTGVTVEGECQLTSMYVCAHSLI